MLVYPRRRDTAGTPAGGISWCAAFDRQSSKPGPRGSSSRSERNRTPRASVPVSVSHIDAMRAPAVGA
jgi:hypothetical protein